MNIGIDAGGTLIKIAYMEQNSLVLNKFPVSELAHVANWINGMSDTRVCMTGGKASALQSLIHLKAEELVEFDATCRGVQYFLEKQGVTETMYVLTNVGTGTSIHLIDSDQHRRLGGTGVGGGTLIGLSQLLTGLTNYEDIIQGAAMGARDRIDLKVSHIYEGAEPPIPGDLTASNFGRILQGASHPPFSREELLASVIGLVGETVATVSVLAAGQSGATTVIFIGSSFIGNHLLKDVVQRYTKLRGASPLFIENGEYAGAIGAWLHEE
ncbi:type II pantothenate kinase [Paenibacillus periandrae]|uniref:type II pantothenate kinase n=1 Tax=Paenibacillus periandrae TaxID=1761741 RepID=UPI001F09009C|nr:type II pantothenate kinase [Paenibacillus periandrae]